MSDEWIVIPSWDRYQHYGDRRPSWIKLYLDLHTRDEWLDLSLAARGLLVDVWLAYGPADGQVSARRLPAKIRHRVRRETLDSLVAAGFIDILASKPLALSQQHLRARPRDREEREEKRETPPTPPAGGNGVILGEALGPEAWSSSPPPPLPKREKRRRDNGDEQPEPKTGRNVMAAMLVWLQSPAFDAETMDESFVIEELEMRERKLRAKVSPQERVELVAIARQKREGYGPDWEGQEP